MNISKETAYDAAFEAGIEPDEDLRFDYSGRGMYGKECLAIVGGADALVRFVLGVAADNDDISWLEGVRSDNMGRSTVWYWPYVQVES